MNEQLRLIDVTPKVITEDINSSYQKLSPEVVSDGQEDVTLYNVKTDFRGLSEANKKRHAIKSGKPVGSPYAELLPDISGLPEPGSKFPEGEEHEQIINAGSISEAKPFMAGVRIALAERRARRQHRVAQSALRSALVGHSVVESLTKGVDEGGDYYSPKNPHRPRTLREKAMAKRMGRLIRRANHHNSSANIMEAMFTEPDASTPQPDFESNKENLSFFEKTWRKGSSRLYKTRREHSERVIHGRRIPLTSKRVGLLSFDRLATGGPTNPHKRATKAIEKRDKAIRKAEALKRARASK